MITFIIALHITVCILLIFIILIQAGRGGGLVEGFSGVESMFGPKTNTFLTRTTTILSILFLFSCLSLALLSAKQSRSLMPLKEDLTEAGLPTQDELPQEKVEAAPTEEVPLSESPIQQATQGEIPKTEEK